MTTTPDLAEIDEDLDALKRRRAKNSSKRLKLEQERRVIDSELENLLVRRRKALIPPEPLGNHGAIRFTVTLPHFSGGDRTYEYAAIRVAGHWYRTGPTCPRGGETWEELVRFLQSGTRHSDVIVMVPDVAVSIPDRV